MCHIQLVSVNVGTPWLLGKRAGRPVYSAIAKHPVATPELYLTPTGLAGDQQTDTHVRSNGDQLHGGPEMALYAYPTEHFAAWADELGQTIGPGAFGENLTIIGLVETQVRIGDIWQWGEEATLQVTKPRRPCYKLNMHRGVPDMIQRMNATGRCGWYLRVLTPGLVPTAGFIEVVEPALATEQTIYQRFMAKNHK